MGYCLRAKGIVLIVLLVVVALSGLSCGDGGAPEQGKIAFSSDRDGDWEIYVMDADGSNQTNLTSSPAVDEFPSWSPDGSMIAFTSDRDGDYEIYVMDADGSNQTNITNSAAYNKEPSWSP